MNRESVRSIAIAILCVLAIGLAASTLNTPVETDSSGGTGIGGLDEGPGAGSEGGDPSLGAGNGTSQRFDIRAALPIPAPCIRILNHPAVIAGLVGTVLIAAFLAFRRVGIFGSIAVFGALGFPLLFVHALLSNCERPSAAEMKFQIPNMTNLPTGGMGGMQPGSTVTPSTPSVVVTIVLGISLVAALILLVKSTAGDTIEYEDESGTAAKPVEQMVAVGRAAGQAADRIESAGTVENEVFKAWREMTTHLDVDRPASSTPAEFAVAAVDAGLNRADVTELTSLFEEVRYGNREATPEREERAVAALRRIEDKYAETNDGATGGEKE